MTSRALLATLAALLISAAIATVSIPWLHSEPDVLGASEPELGRKQDAVKEPLVAIESRVAGTDTNLQMEMESAIAVNPRNPLQIAVAQSNSVRMSQDGGAAFSAPSNVGTSLPAGYSGRGDDSLAFDANGRLFLSFLGSSAVGGLDLFVVQIDPLTGAPIGNARNVSDQAAMPAAMQSDKPWIAVDTSERSPHTGTIYVVWAVTGGATTGEWEIWAARSWDQGVTWTPSVRSGFGWGPISSWAAAEGRAWTPHLGVGTNGSVWVAYHAQGNYLWFGGRGVPDGISGQVPILRSDDGGISYNQLPSAFGPGESDITLNNKDRPGDIADLGIWTIGSWQPWVLPDPNNACKVYVVAADDPDNDPFNGDASDVVMATTTDCGNSWNVETVDGGPAEEETWQLFPTAAIDPETGFITVTWYDNRGSNLYPLGLRGNSRFDLAMRVRTSGGFWEPTQRVSDNSIDADRSSSRTSGSPPTYRFGEYNGVAYGECTAHMIWSGSPLAGNADIYYDRDPEAGGDVDLPTIACPANIVVACGDDISPAATGEPVVDDNCDRNPEVSYSDFALPVISCEAPVGKQFERHWRVKDAAGNSDDCFQLINVTGPCCT